MSPTSLAAVLPPAIAARQPLLESDHHSALRLFNGFYEGLPELAVDLYGATAVLHDYAEEPETGARHCREALTIIRELLPWVRCVLAKHRSAAESAARRGVCLYGGDPDPHIREHEVRYAIELTMNRDTSLYLDTRGLRRWALDHLSGKTVLNTFAYTGSLGVAALAGGAAHVVQLDLNRRFLRLAERSCVLNGLPSAAHEIMEGDFFPRVSQMKRAGRRFDCVFLDPPFFASSGRGTVDLENNLGRLINKVRPLVAHEGRLVVVNNALYVSGHQFMATLADLCADGFLAVESTIGVPEDFTGYPSTLVREPVTDPAPFNHSTKIAVLRVTRKDSEGAGA